jgi:DNA-binding PadR family transcriptional regulator
MTQSSRRRGPRAFRSVWSLAVLGLLREHDMHPYEMQRQLQHRHTLDLLALKRGSLYHAIGQLQRADLIEPVETSRAGRWPERTIYRITPAGVDELVVWLRDMLAEPVREPSTFIAGLTHIFHLAPADALQQLQLRLVSLEASVASMAAIEVGIGELIGRAAVLEVEYARAMATAELTWVRGIVDELQHGKLQWTFDKINADINKPDSKVDIVQDRSDCDD